MVYKRWKGKKIKPGDPNYDKARWWIEYRLKGRRIHQAVPEARTKAQAERAETSEREAIYNRRYNKGTDTDSRLTIRSPICRGSSRKSVPGSLTRRAALRS